MVKKMVKKIDENIKKAFADVGFSNEEVQAGCWLLERSGKEVAWIALHKFLEQVAHRANIVFDEPKIFNCTPDEVALYVCGRKGDVSAWSVGEASKTNNQNAYRWAMAEKRAKDRVILKLLGIAGDMYSEEEAEEFKKEEQKQNQKKSDVLYRYEKSIKYCQGLSEISDEVLIKRINDLLDDLASYGFEEEKEKLTAVVNSKMKKEEIAQ